MVLEYQPPGLKGVINGPRAEKQLKNREGYAVGKDQSGRSVWAKEGLLIEVHREALVFDAANPNSRVTVFSQTCSGHTFTPDLQRL